MTNSTRSEKINNGFDEKYIGKIDYKKISNLYIYILYII